MEQLLNLPLYTTLLLGEPSPRGYINGHGIRQECVLPTNNGNVSARDYFHAAEYKRRKITPVERGLLLQCLDTNFLRGFAYELPFVLETEIEGVHGSAVEVYMRGFRYVAYLETMGAAPKLFQFVRIPLDASDPEIHIYQSRLVAAALAEMR